MTAVSEPTDPPSQVSADPLPPVVDSSGPTGHPAVDSGVVDSSGPTGHPAVDAALAELDAAAELEPAQQVGAYEQAHRALSQTLAAIDQS